MRRARTSSRYGTRRCVRSAVIRIVTCAVTVALAQEGLKCNHTLVELNLMANNLCDAGAKFISDSLRANTTLTKLDLSRNFLRRDVRVDPPSVSHSCVSPCTLMGLAVCVLACRGP